GEVLGIGVVLGDAHGIGGGDQGGRRRQLQYRRLRGDIGQQDRRVGRRHERRLVVLAGREDDETDRFGLRRGRDRGLDPVELGGGGAVGGIGGDVPDGEDSDFHDCSFCSLQVRRWRRASPSPPTHFNFEVTS